jgi:glycosyltransferase involved in cell wall biosynthesis
MDKVSVVILTYNEEVHISRCIDRISELSDDIHIIDSYSTDRTVELCQKVGCVVTQRSWPGVHSKQLQWAIENCKFLHQWVLRLDADEYLDGDLIAEIKTLKPSSDTDAYILKRGHVFLGKKMIHDGCFPVPLLRLWRQGTVECDQRLMDEHLQMINKVSKIGRLSGFMWDHSLKSISDWIEKHNDYSSKEALEIINRRIEILERPSVASHSIKHWIKSHVYERMPIGLRSFFYFFYRYILRGGFRDGYEGLAWCFLQGCWYRFLADVKVTELEKILSDGGIEKLRTKILNKEIHIDQNE